MGIACATLGMLGLLVFGSPAHAVVIDFEGVAGAGLKAVVASPYDEDGFRFSSTSSFAINDAAFDGPGAEGGVGNSAYLRIPNSPNGVLTAIDGSLFSLASLDVGGDGTVQSLFSIEGFRPGSTSADFIENVDVTLAFGDPLQNLSLTGWTGLERVVFTYQGSLAGVAVDNLSVAKASVPEPLSLVLMSVGLLGVAAARRG